MAILQFVGERFLPGKQYRLEDLSETVRMLAAQNDWWVFASVHARMEELQVSLLDLERCLKRGEVVEFEVGPSRVEMRLVMRYEQGDVAAYRPVVWLDRDGKLCCADIRDGTEGGTV